MFKRKKLILASVFLRQCFEVITKEKHLRATPRKGTSYLRKVEKQDRSQYLSKCARTPLLSITVD